MGECMSLTQFGMVLLPLVFSLLLNALGQGMLSVSLLVFCIQTYAVNSAKCLLEMEKLHTSVL